MIIYILYFLVFLLYSIYSYAFTDPNLVLTSYEAYWSFQQWMWTHVLPDSQGLAIGFVTIIIIMFVLYSKLISYLKNKHKIPTNIIKSKYFWYYLLLLAPLLLSYNALSHDIFNYIFNAKMIGVYGVNPHIHTATEFPADLWTRFMHNTHTAAPYGYGWTAASMIPYFLGFKKFITTLFAFRIFSLTSLVFLYFAMQEFSKGFFKRKLELYELALVFLNPLLLIEVVSNYHNDLWMMAPAILSLGIILKLVNHKSIEYRKKVIFTAISAVLMFFSMSIKLATFMISPIWIWAFGMLFISEKTVSIVQHKLKIRVPKFIFEKIFYRLLETTMLYIPGAAATIMFIPLLTARSQQFHPWYLLWILVWIPFFKGSKARNFIIVFSLSSLLRYTPWIANGLQYDNGTLVIQKIITWVIPLVFFFTHFTDSVKKIKLK